ncbi:MAG: glycosyltransferase [Steroidobacteraceae bacterium]|jgi:glycosyltransferase involved in cell wall biosynthesis/predicted SAM-dependent methyltransferase
MKKLNLGCGPHIIGGWDNLDLQPGAGGIVCDLSKALPYADDSVDCIFSEHFLEHLTRKDALSLLSECKRVLKPLGRIRLSTPDMRTIARDYLHGRLDRWAPLGFVGKTPCEHINAGMREWGHTFVYDWTELELIFNEAGLGNIKRKMAGFSDDPAFSKLETRPYFDDLIIEAQKPLAQSPPRVSVVMTSFNHEKFVGRTIESVLGQTMQDFEFCITDDGSSDGTCEVIRSFKDPRINFVELETNRGACYSMNQSIRRSRGRFIAIINSDDVFDAAKLQRQLDILERDTSIGAVFTHVSFIDENGATLDQDKLHLGNFNQLDYHRNDWLARLYINGNCLCHPSAMVRRECYLIEGLYDERFRQLPDYLMWIRILKRWNIRVIPERLVGFRHRLDLRNESAPTADVARRGTWELIQIAKEILSFSEQDFRHVVGLVLTDKPASWFESNSREFIFATLALKLASTPMIQAAMDLIYESYARAGSGGDFHALKLPSVLATLVNHRGFEMVAAT